MKSDAAARSVLSPRVSVVPSASINWPVTTLRMRLIAVGWLDGIWLEIIKIGTLKRFFDMQCAWCAVETDAPPVINAVSGVGVLLNLQNEIAATDGVDPPAGDKNRFACMHLHAVHEWFEIVVLQARFEVCAGHAIFEAGHECGLWRGVDDIPDLGLRFAAEARRDAGGRVDL